MISACVTGNVGNVEMRTAGSTPVLSFTLASNERDGKGNETTTWVRCAVFGERANKIQSFITKGKKLAVSGQLSNRSYEVSGEKRSSLEMKVDGLEFLDKKTDGVTAPREEAPSSPSQDEDQSIPF